MIFDRPDNLSRHVKTGSTEPEEIFVGGKYRKTGYVVPQDDRFYPYTSSFDFESLLV